MLLHILQHHDFNGFIMFSHMHVLEFISFSYYLVFTLLFQNFLL